MCVGGGGEGGVSFECIGTSTVLFVVVVVAAAAVINGMCYGWLFVIIVDGVKLKAGLF